MHTTVTTSRRLLAEQASQTAQALSDALDQLQRLRSAMLSQIDELDGDRDFNWSLQADLGYAESQIYAVAQKARTVASHAAGKKTGRDGSRLEAIDQP